MMKKLGSIAVAASMLTGTVAPQMGAIASAAAAPAAVAAVGLGTLLTPGTAHAQSGSRVCAMRFGGSGLNLWMYMEVSKYDFVTCVATVAVFEFILGTDSLRGWAGNGITYHLSGGLRVNNTCERFSSDIGWSNPDICNETTRYKIYAVMNLWNRKGLRQLT